MKKTVYHIDEHKRTLVSDTYDISGTPKRLGWLIVPVGKITMAELNTLAITRLSGQVQFLRIKEAFNDGTYLCEEWV